jgi:hypothetical protein
MDQHHSATLVHVSTDKHIRTFTSRTLNSAAHFPLQVDCTNGINILLVIPFCHVKKELSGTNAMGATLLREMNG